MQLVRSPETTATRTSLHMQVEGCKRCGLPFFALSLSSYNRRSQLGIIFFPLVYKEYNQKS